MRQSSGYAIVADPDRPLQEWDTASCCHCGGIIFVKPGTGATTYLIADPIAGIWREEPGASCWHCFRPVCLTCHAHGRCTPLERRLQQSERSGRPI